MTAIMKKQLISKTPMNKNEERKRSRKRSKKVEWITLQTKSYKSPITTPKKLSPRESKPKNTIPEKVFRPFTRTNITFNREEMTMLEPTPEFQETLKLYRSPSKLLQLQNTMLEREQDKILIRQELKEERKPKEKIEKSDSFISINFNDEDEFINAEALDTDDLNDENGIEKFNPTDESALKYLKISVWACCHELYPDFETKTYNEVNGTMYQSNHKTMISIKPSKGNQKVRKAILDHTEEGDQLNSFAPEQILTPEQRIEEKQIKNDMAETYSGLKLRRFIERNGHIAPSFLGDIDFTKTTAPTKTKPNLPKLAQPKKNLAMTSPI